MSQSRPDLSVLFYVEPLIERGDPFFKYNWATDFSYKTAKALSESGLGFSSYLIVNEPVSSRMTPETSKPFQGIFVCSQDDLFKPYPSRDALQITKDWFCGRLSDHEIAYFKDLYVQKLKGMIPDIIVTYSPAPHLNRIFPNALILHKEYSIFSRAPFPQTWHLDPVGVSPSSFLDRFGTQMTEQFEVSQPDRLHLESFLEEARNLLERANPFKMQLQAAKEKFDRLVLLPTQFSDYYIFDGQASFQSQFQFVQETLERIPSTVGVLLTMHPEHPTLSRESVEYLKNKHLNLIYHDEFDDFYGSSQYLLPHCDAVITVSSSLGVQALLWNVKIVSLGRQFMRFGADSHSLENLGELLERPTPDRTGLLFWLLTRYCIPSYRLHDPQWIGGRLKTMYLSFKSLGLRPNFFDPIDRSERVFDSLRESLIQNVPQRAHALSYRQLQFKIRNLERENQILRANSRLWLLRRLKIEDSYLIRAVKSITSKNRRLS